MKDTIRWLFGVSDADVGVDVGARPLAPGPPPEDTPGMRILWAALGVLSTRPYEARAQAESTLRSELDAVRPMDWPTLDEAMRPGAWRLFVGWYYQADGGDAERWAAELPVDSPVLQVLASHSSGYVREVMVDALGAPGGDGRELAALLVRANDWVNAIRGRAVEALRARLVPAYADAWVAHLPLVHWLRDCRRADHGPLVDAVLHLLRTDVAREALMRGLRSDDRLVRRASLRLLLERAGPEMDELISVALATADPVIRIRAAGLLRVRGDAAARAHAPRLIADPLWRVRIEGLRLVADDPAAAPVFRRALLDRSAYIRALARKTLGRAAPQDFAAFYRDALREDAPALPAALMGFGETGGRDDADGVRPFLAHSRGRVRSAALHALDALMGEDAMDALLAAFADPSRAVSRWAFDLLRPYAKRVDEAKLAALFATRQPGHARMKALALLDARGPWVGLPYLLRATADADREVARRGKARLGSWVARCTNVPARPTPAQLASAVAALDASEASIRPETRTELRFILRTTPTRSG